MVRGISSWIDAPGVGRKRGNLALLGLAASESTSVVLIATGESAEERRE